MPRLPSATQRLSKLVLSSRSACTSLLTHIVHAQALTSGQPLDMNAKPKNLCPRLTQTPSDAGNSFEHMGTRPGFIITAAPNRTLLFIHIIDIRLRFI